MNKPAPPVWAQNLCALNGYTVKWVESHADPCWTVQRGDSSFTFGFQHPLQYYVDWFERVDRTGYP